MYISTFLSRRLNLELVSEELTNRSTRLGARLIHETQTTFNNATISA